MKQNPLPKKDIEKAFRYQQKLFPDYDIISVSEVSDDNAGSSADQIEVPADEGENDIKDIPEVE